MRKDEDQQTAEDQQDPVQSDLQRRVRLWIPAERAGICLIELLTDRFPYHHRDEWTALVAAGCVRLNGQHVGPQTCIAKGDLLEYTADHIPEPAVNTHVIVVHDDEDLLVVDKPPNLPCHPGGRYFNHTLWAILKTQYDIPAPSFVNRLDRETSGLVIVARNENVARQCRDQFARRRVEKRYVALVEGSFPAAMLARGFLEADAAAEVRKRQRFLPADSWPSGSERPPSNWAETSFKRIAQHGPITEIEALPHTGRMHQIRATLSSSGYAVVGDKLYGVDPGIFLRFCRGELSDEDRRRLRLDRQALHAAGLTLHHPRTRRLLCLEAQLPADMGLLITRMDRSPVNGAP